MKVRLNRERNFVFMIYSIFCIFDFTNNIHTLIIMVSFLKKLTKSFDYAFQGIASMFKQTPNAWIHLYLTILAVGLGFVFEISRGEWLAIIIVIGLVFSLEAINTALENLADYACDKKIHPLIKSAKDIAAGGVLLAAFSAFAVGLVVFLKRIIELF